MNTKPFHQFVHKLIITIIVAIVVFGCSKTSAVKKVNTVEKDSISIWIEQAENSNFSILDRKLSLDKAYAISKLISNDSTRLDKLSAIAIEAEDLNHDELFLIVNSQALSLSIKEENFYKIGDAHWNYGSYYTNKERIDSAYFHFHEAYDAFERIDHKKFMARMLYNLGFIQGRIKDYTGSEISIINAIEIYKKLERHDNLYSCYNYLGLIYLEMEEYERAIFSHNTALVHLTKSAKKRAYKEWSLNNLGLIYQRQEKFDDAIVKFRLALRARNLKFRDINLFAKLFDNIGYTKLLKGDTANVNNELRYSLKIRDSIKSISGVAISKRHLSELYAFKRDTLTALTFANEAYDLANLVENNRDKLETLLLLSKIDTKNATKHLKEYLHLNDSLQIEDRKTRNKFTRIRFETDEYIEETEKLAVETEKLTQQIIYISLASLTVLSFFALAYFLIMQRTRNKELLFEQEQQKSNEEIFSLMLKQQSKLEEGRMKERHRISEDLHDGVLGKIFGTRLGLGFLEVKGDESTIKKHTEYIDELQRIEKEIRSISHELKNEILSSKENYTKIIHDLIEQKSKLGKFNFEFNCDSVIDWDDIKDEIKINYYRIVQEGLQNIIKYAEATLVEVDIKLVNNVLNLRIRDNGKGFKNGKLVKKGIGLKNIESRTKKLNGNFKINSLINKGTIIFVSNPL